MSAKIVKTFEYDTNLIQINLLSQLAFVYWIKTLKLP